MIAFIGDRLDVYGVEPICRVLPIAGWRASRAAHASFVIFRRACRGG